MTNDREFAAKMRQRRGDPARTTSEGEAEPWHIAMARDVAPDITHNVAVVLLLLHNAGFRRPDTGQL